MLKSAGYATACVGKWRLGWRRELRPQTQCFDEFFGLLHTNDAEEWTVGRSYHQLSTFDPLQLRDGDRVIESPVDLAMGVGSRVHCPTGRANKNRTVEVFVSRKKGGNPRH